MKGQPRRGGQSQNSNTFIFYASYFVQLHMSILNSRRAVVGPYLSSAADRHQRHHSLWQFQRRSQRCQFLPDHANDGWPTEWFYVDLTSNWDTNGNGCFGDGIFGDKSNQAANHYTPDASGTLFNNTVSLGRIPIDDPTQSMPCSTACSSRAKRRLQAQGFAGFLDDGFEERLECLLAAAG